MYAQTKYLSIDAIYAKLFNCNSYRDYKKNQNYNEYKVSENEVKNAYEFGKIAQVTLLADHALRTGKLDGIGMYLNSDELAELAEEMTTECLFDTSYSNMSPSMRYIILAFVRGYYDAHEASFSSKQKAAVTTFIKQEFELYDLKQLS